MFDKATPHAIIQFPNTNDVFCKITAHILIDKPLHVRGAEHSSIHRTDPETQTQGSMAIGNIFRNIGQNGQLIDVFPI